MRSATLQNTLFVANHSTNKSKIFILTYLLKKKSIIIHVFGNAFGV